MKPKFGKLTKDAQKWVVPKCGLIDKSMYPAIGTYARKIWDIADDITAESSRMPTTNDVVSKANRSKIPESTTKVQFGYWRKAHPGHSCSIPAKFNNKKMAS